MARSIVGLVITKPHRLGAERAKARSYNVLALAGHRSGAERAKARSYIVLRRHLPRRVSIRMVGLKHGHCHPDSYVRGMAHKEQKQYRLPVHNYGRAGVYFVTICVLNKVPSFGNIVDGRMVLSAIGEEVARAWPAIPSHYPLARLDQWVIMPDHFHGVLILKPNENDLLKNQDDETPAGLRPLRASSLPAIINQFKGGVKRWCNQNGHDTFAWQPRYHDHIVRDIDALSKIRDYIIRNPENWETEL